jgi:aspartokinase/homoserine dehydrogenase 2
MVNKAVGKLKLADVNIVLLGKGNVGNAWLSLFEEQKARYADTITVNLIAVANSSKYLLNLAGLSVDEFNNFSDNSTAGNLSALTEQITQAKLDNVLVIDVTASQKITHSYPEFASLGWHIISANKIPGTVSSERYKRLISLLKSNACYWGINATVGAALPIQASLVELIQAGDRILSISGVFSGSLSYLLVNYDGKTSFTDLIKQAREAGFTEPDPRDDLSGADVQKKLLILARLAGYIINLDDIEVQPLLPAKWLKGSLDDFWGSKDQIDSYMAEQFWAAEQENKKLVYQAKVSFVDKVALTSVGLTSLPSSNAVTQLSPTDNVFTLKTDFYNENPLIIRGPGAGAIVTATAVNIDLNKFVTQLAISNETSNHKNN